MGGIGLAIVILMGLLAVLAPQVAPYPPNLQHPGFELRPPSSQFWLGSDDLGRDLFTRILFGARVSFLVGILATAIGASVGITTGLLSGYLGGWVDSVIMRFYDALLAFPGIIIGIAVISILGPSTLNVAYALAIGGMPFFARLMRSGVLSERERDYIYAAVGWRWRWAHHVSARPPEYTCAFARAAQPGHGLRGPGGSGSVVPWAGNATSRSELGHDAQ